MASRLRRGDASGPAEWLLAFLQARDHPPGARVGRAAGPTEWLLVFLGAATAGAAPRAAAPHGPACADDPMACHGGEST